MTDCPTILIAGSGVIGSRTLYDLAHSTARRRLHLHGRNHRTVSERRNLAHFSALQRGFSPTITSSVGDVLDHDNFAEVIDRTKPDVIFLAVSLQSWWVITQLPSEQAAALAEAHYGPWLPMHLAPVASAMRAIRSASCSAIVINAAFPDAVHPILSSDRLSPLVGIGNVANNVPALRVIAAAKLDLPVDEVKVHFAAHHYVTHRMRYGDTGGAPTAYRVFAQGEDVTTRVPLPASLKMLGETHSRTPGIDGQSMVASSAVAMVEAMAHNRATSTHAPGPNGMVGGYPVTTVDRSIRIDLPDSLDLSEAIRVNELGQKFDGIESIENGTVNFTEHSQDIMMKTLGYNCPGLHWTQAEDWAEELGSRLRHYSTKGR